MQTAKQDAINTIQQLPDNADTEEMIYRLYAQGSPHFNAIIGDVRVI